ncbi:MAG: heme-binding protein [Candidatus Thermoplasmatota archaeon]|nr:heme-binding protein [Candidatus Thermoplasmatota archaeon]
MTESIEYSVLRVDGRVEVRQYPPLVLVAVHGLDDNQAFGILFDYIAGNNKMSRSIPMTAPVISAKSSGEKIPMTAPVISKQGLFAFVLPSGYTVENTPTPVDTRAKLTAVPPRKLAVLRFRGRTTERTVRSRTAELTSWLKKVNMRPTGEPLLMRYNPPFVPGFLRRNEIAFEVEH